MGLGTRSEVKKLIKTGQIAINGTVAAKPETKVDTDADEVSVNGRIVKYQRYEYYLLNKPSGCVSATCDNVHDTVMDYITDAVHDDLFPVGRLDIDTEGLLLLTNDGQLAHRIISPKHGVWKTYYCEHEGQASEADVRAFKDGLQLADGLSCLPAVLIPLGAGRSAVRVQEGKFHQVRRMMAARGLPLFYLKRVAEGGLWLESLAPGAVLELDMGETERRITSPCDFDEKKLLANCVRNSQPFGGNDEKL